MTAFGLTPDAYTAFLKNQGVIFLPLAAGFFAYVPEDVSCPVPLQELPRDEGAVVAPKFYYLIADRRGALEMVNGCLARAGAEERVNPRGKLVILAKENSQVSYFDFNNRAAVPPHNLEQKAFVHAHGTLNWWDIDLGAGSAATPVPEIHLLGAGAVLNYRCIRRASTALPPPPLVHRHAGAQCELKSYAVEVGVVPPGLAAEIDALPMEYAVELAKELEW